MQQLNNYVAGSNPVQSIYSLVAQLVEQIKVYVTCINNSIIPSDPQGVGSDC